jgi:hypothetical protein
VRDPVGSVVGALLLAGSAYACHPAPLSSSAGRRASSAALATDDRSRVRVLYVEDAPFDNKSTVDIVGVNRACGYVLLKVTCASRSLAESRGPRQGESAPARSCPHLALDAVDYERGALRERWVATEKTARTFTQYADVEGGWPIEFREAPSPGKKSAPCPGVLAPSLVGAELERLANTGDRHVVDSYDDPRMVTWTRWMGTARDGVPQKLEPGDLTALTEAAQVASWGDDRKHVYLVGRWEASRCLYELALEDREGATLATRRSFCRASENDGESRFVVSSGHRAAVQLTSPAEAGGPTPYSVFDLASGQVVKTSSVDLGETDVAASPALSDDGILWVSREGAHPPLVADLMCARVAGVDAPPGLGKTGKVFEIPAAGPGLAKAATTVWVDESHVVTLRATDDGREALVKVDARAFLPSADENCRPVAPKTRP